MTQKISQPNLLLTKNNLNLFGSSKENNIFNTINSISQHFETSEIFDEMETYSTSSSLFGIKSLNNGKINWKKFVSLEKREEKKRSTLHKIKQM